MDLGAYANIDRLEETIKKNNIVIPRMRGLRLMSEEELVTAEDMEYILKILKKSVKICLEPFRFIR